MKYLKWVFGTNVANKENEKFKISEEIIADKWNPTNNNWDLKGGFNFTVEKCALRWMSRGDTLYEVEIPKDGEIYEVENIKTPGGIIIANKIILKNPIPISSELLNHFYEISELPIKTYFECIGLLASRGYYDLSLRIIKDKITKENIDIAIETYNNSIKPWHKVDYDCYNKVKEVLEEIKSDIKINLFIDKEPLVLEISNYKIINLSGQSGAGKSTYAKNNYNSDNYVIIDTDEVFSESRFNNATGLNKELGEYFRNKYDTLPNCCDDFDLVYKEILKYTEKTDKIIVIDSAQFHCMKDITLLKGKLVFIRTCITNCYNRTIKRYISQNQNYLKEELEKFKERKKEIFSWYKSTNKFLENINVFINNKNEHIKEIRKELTNKDFTLLTNNCLAGFIYHDLGLKFRTPTINIRIKPKEFISFVNDLNYYLNQDVEEVRDINQSFPVGRIKGDENHIDVNIEFQHYKTFKEGKNKWNERKVRINLNNIYIIMEFFDGIHDESLLSKFIDIPYKNKMILTHKNHDLEYTYAITCFDDNMDMSEIGGKIFRYNGLSGKRNYEEFDYIKFLNKK